MNTSDPTSSGDTAETEALRRIIGFITGKHADVSQLLQAIEVLRACKTGPDKLRQLRSVVCGAVESESDEYEACRNVQESLEEYLALEPAQRKQAMAQVTEHLQSCEHCRRHLEVLEELLPAAAHDKVDVPPVLKLVSRQWRLISPQGQVLPQPSADAFVFRMPINPFLRLRELRHEERELAMAMPDDLPKLPLSMRVGGGAAEVDLLVIPERRIGQVPGQASQQQDVWIMQFTLVTAQQTTRLEVGLGGAQGQTTGMRTLSVEHKAEFEVQPPGAQTYWAYFEWFSSEGALLKDEVELPLRSGTESEPDQ